MAADPVVILSAARTPLGRFMGELSPFSAHKLGSHVIGAALERAKLAPERIDEVLHGQCAAGRTGPGPGAAGRAGSKTAGCHRRHHHQQGLRLRHEGDHAGA